MASTPDSRLAEVTRVYQDRINHYDTDMDAAPDRAQLIDQQLRDAQEAYDLALQKAFLGDTQEIDKVATDLKAANDQVDQLRAQDELIDKILTEAGQAINFAKTLTQIVA